jgi:hypothetical protein
MRLSELWKNEVVSIDAFGVKHFWRWLFAQNLRRRQK